MSDLRELYQEVIVDHSRSPRNRREMPDANRRAEGYNPLCGDRVTLFVKLNDEGAIEDVSFQGSGCAISTSSASLLTEILKGKTRAQAEALFEEFHDMVTGDPTASPEVGSLGKLAALAGVREFPSRIKCATLVWYTLRQALDEGDALAERTDAPPPAQTE